MTDFRTIFDQSMIRILVDGIIDFFCVIFSTVFNRFIYLSGCGELKRISCRFVHDASHLFRIFASRYPIHNFWKQTQANTHTYTERRQNCLNNKIDIVFVSCIAVGKKFSLSKNLRIANAIGKTYTTLVICTIYTNTLWHKQMKKKTLKRLRR